MTQDERWLHQLIIVIEYVEKNHRNPSRHRIEEHDMLNWLKSKRKKMNADYLKGNNSFPYVICWWEGHVDET